MKRAWWEENGWTSEWYQHQHDLRTGRVPDEKVMRIIMKHGSKAWDEVASLMQAGYYKGVLERIDMTQRPVEPAAPVVQADLFA